MGFEEQADKSKTITTMGIFIILHSRLKIKN